MFKKNKIDDTPPYIKYTELGFPYVDVDLLFNSEDGRKLYERMKVIRDLSIYRSGSSSRKTDNKST